MPFRERQSAERLADHDAGIGDHRVEAAEAMNSRFDGVGRGAFVAHIAFDDGYIALAREGAVQLAIRKIDDADLPSRRNQMARNGAADALCPSGDQGDGFCRGHVADCAGQSRSTGRSGRPPHSAQEPS